MSTIYGHVESLATLVLAIADDHYQEPKRHLAKADHDALQRASLTLLDLVVELRDAESVMDEQQAELLSLKRDTKVEDDLIYSMAYSEGQAEALSQLDDAYDRGAVDGYGRGFNEGHTEDYMDGYDRGFKIGKKIEVENQAKGHISDLDPEKVYLQRFARQVARAINEYETRGAVPEHIHEKMPTPTEMEREES